MKLNRRWLAAGGTAIALGAAGTGTALAVSNSSDDVPITGDALEQATAAALAHTNGGTVTDTEIEDEESYYEVEVTLDNGQEIDVQLDEQFNVVGEEVDDEQDEADGDDVPITGDALEQATAAALAHTDGGTVTETEVEGGEEEAYYEVEVILDDGQEVELELDEQFNVVGEEVDDD